MWRKTSSMGILAKAYVLNPTNKETEAGKQGLAEVSRQVGEDPQGQCCPSRWSRLEAGGWRSGNGPGLCSWLAPRQCSALAAQLKANVIHMAQAH